MRWRVVFDTNILIAALLSPHGSPALCLDLARQGKIDSLTCQEIINKFQEKLQIKFSYPRENIQEIIQNFLLYSELLTISNQLQGISSDPDDNKIIECAVVGKATHIITEDKKH